MDNIDVTSFQRMRREKRQQKKEALTLTELKEKAKEAGVKGFSRMKADELIKALGL